MLKTVIKRDGSEESFIPEKLNKWSRWASNDISERVDWSGVVLKSIKDTPEKMTSQELQERLIDSCLSFNSWPYQIMAGRLYASILRKRIFNHVVPPTIKKLHKYLTNKGILNNLGYTEEEYEYLETVIDHSRDFNLAYFQLRYIDHKYTLQNKTQNIVYETPQFVYMRMAMAIMKDESKDKKLNMVKELYDHLSLNRINAPTPNFTNLGVTNNGLSSCCLYIADDDARSLAIGDHIAYTQTYMSAGIGSNINTRSIKDPVRNGKIEHQGKLPYLAALGKAVKANKQGSRGGACTTYFSCYDPEVISLIMLQNPKTPDSLKNRDLHLGIMTNRLFAKKVAKSHNIFTFNKFTAPDLVELFYSDKQDEFESLYEEYENNNTFHKNYINAREIALKFSQQFYDVSTLYHLAIDEVNRHTSFKDPIYSSNLCCEIVQPTKPYFNMKDLYSNEPHENGEVSLCTIAGIVYPNIKSDEEYDSAVYYTLYMIDKCIDTAYYELPHVGVTAKLRRNAAVGLVGLALEFARQNEQFNTPSGLKLAHEIAERHAYFVIKNALKLGKEKGNAPWIDKTKWPDGWLPIDTYKKQVDQLAEPNYKYDWESLRKEIIDNKGIRFSSLISHMPTESSSKASGVPNGIYPVRNLSLKKTEGSNSIEWCAVDEDIIGNQYQIAWDILEIDLIKYYSVIQKFTDQSISADLYKDRTQEIMISTSDMLETYLAMMKYGLKAKYYTNSLTSEESKNNSISVGCDGGACTL